MRMKSTRTRLTASTPSKAFARCVIPAFSLRTAAATSARSDAPLAPALRNATPARMVTHYSTTELAAASAPRNAQSATQRVNARSARRDIFSLESAGFE